MANIEQGNPFLELKQRTDRDVRQLGPIVGQTYGPVESTAAQSVINLSFAVEQTDTAKKQVQLYVDGKLLSEGVGNDYTYVGAVNGQSSQIQLAAPLAAGLNIFAQRVGVSIQNFPSPATVQATLNNDVAQPNLMAKAGFQNFIEPKYADAPFTQIQNRAQVLDLTNSLGAIAGVERVHVKGINLLSNEFGPNGQNVYEAGNGDNRIRFVGTWTSLDNTNGGLCFSANNTTDFIEITFYGTGLNLITLLDGNARDSRASVDGGPEGANLIVVNSTVINARNYRPNHIISIASGLSLGWHTAKIRNNSGTFQLFASGFEVLNERTDLAVLPGTAYAGMKREILSALSATAFNAGVSGSRGARIVKYVQNGAISQAVQEVNPSAAFLASADHTNEEPVRRINWREFGANRADDFSTLAGSSNRAFTLDDGTTTLTGSNVAELTSAVVLNVNAAFLTFTFIGTGLDVTWGVSAAGGTNTPANHHEVFVDGVSVGNWDTIGAITPTQKRICSGLPYGTHTVKFLRNVPTVWALSIHDFIIYQPKKPSIPVDAVEIVDYNVMSSFAALSHSLDNIDTISSGIIRKHLATREATYVGSYSAPLLGVGTYIGGFDTATGTSTNYFEYTFWGTGFEIRSRANTVYTGNATLRIDGNVNFSGFTSAAFGGYSIVNAVTGQIALNASNSTGSGVRITGLTLGFHTVRLTNNAAATMTVETIDIIAPIHVSKPSLKVGNLSLSRNEDYQPVKAETIPGLDLSRAKAWILFDQANTKILASYNISAVLNIATGNSLVYFEKPFKKDYVISGTCVSSPNTVLSVSSKPLNYASFFCILNAASNTNSIFAAVFYGELVDEE